MFHSSESSASYHSNDDEELVSPLCPVDPPPTGEVAESQEQILQQYSCSSELRDFSSSEREVDLAPALHDPLRSWAVDNIFAAHITKLLKILQPHHPDLPSDARTLLRTPHASSH